MGCKHKVCCLRHSISDLANCWLYRAWLRSADTAYEKKQKQLMLIVNNLGGSLASGSDIYRIVVDAWRNAMGLMEKIVLGMPQSVEHPELMLALSSWHLYPDMTILHGKVKTVRQNDPLITAGGIITLGLHNPTISNDLGITWSLPLSHLRYYGKPATRTGVVGIKRSRVSMDELLFVALGCVTNGWGSDSADLNRCARFIDAMRRNFVRNRGYIDPPRWLQVLGKAALNYLSLDPQSQKEADRLVAFGRRRCSTFLAISKQNLPDVFNLRDPARLLRMIKDPESGIAWLRKIAVNNVVERQQGMLERAVIRYRPSAAKETLPPSVHWTQPDLDDHDYFDKRVYEWASLLPRQPADEGTSKHRRWIPSLIGGNLSQVTHVSSLGKYVHVSTATAERRLFLEHTSKESCIVFTTLIGKSSASGERSLHNDETAGNFFNEWKARNSWETDLWILDAQPMIQGLRDSGPLVSPAQPLPPPVTLLPTLGSASFNVARPSYSKMLPRIGPFANHPTTKIEEEAIRMLQITNNFLSETTISPTAPIGETPASASQISSSSYTKEGPRSVSSIPMNQQIHSPYKWYVPAAGPAAGPAEQLSKKAVIAILTKTHPHEPNTR